MHLLTFTYIYLIFYIFSEKWAHKNKGKMKSGIIRPSV